mmetsp:Transcript_15584/g.20961  ORF Transcript_15584/g.20961 Transcript_15584/m.20961 type:complete len:215 (-) Transcript_15584:147-791(-)
MHAVRNWAPPSHFHSTTRRSNKKIIVCGIRRSSCAINSHDNLAHCLAREHVLDSVRHAVEALERALVVDEGFQLTTRMEIEDPLLTPGNRPVVFWPSVPVDSLPSSGNRLRLPKEGTGLQLVTRSLRFSVWVVRILRDVPDLQNATVVFQVLQDCLEHLPTHTFKSHVHAGGCNALESLADVCGAMVDDVIAAKVTERTRLFGGRASTDNSAPG